MADLALEPAPRGIADRDQPALGARLRQRLPNLVTGSRLVLILVAAELIAHPAYGRLGLALGFVAGLTDYLDGYLARRLGQVTHLGAILDQLADQVFCATALLALSRLDGGPPALVLVAYLLREFWVAGVRRFMAAHGVRVESSIYGKLKTNFLGWGFFCLAAHLLGVWPALDPALALLGAVGIYGGLVFSYVSGWLYTAPFIRLARSLEAPAPPRGVHRGGHRPPSR